MSNDAVWFVSADGQSRQGPLTAGQVRSMIASGAVNKASLFWRQGMAAWAQLADVPELQGLPVPPSAAPSPGIAPPGVAMPIPPGELAPAPRKSNASVITLIVVGSVLGLCLLSAIPVGILLPALGKARGSARQIEDSTQVRGVQQALAIWAQNNSDQYVIPSDIDKAHNTIAAGELKDTPSNIASILIYNGFVSPDLLISPAEANPAFAVYADYQYSRPPLAAGADKNLALWDPGFRAYPVEWASTGQVTSPTGGLSYAIMPPVGARRPKFSNTFNATEAIVGNRGPAYDAVGSGPTLRWTLHPDNGPSPTGNAEVGTNSYTLLIHGGRTTWEGNVAFNDMHVNFETRPDPESLIFHFNDLPPGQQTQLDNLFVDENDATRVKDSTTGVNNANTNNLIRGWNGGEFDPKSGKLLSITSHLWFD